MDNKRTQVKRIVARTEVSVAMSQARVERSAVVVRRSQELIEHLKKLKAWLYPFRISK